MLCVNKVFVDFNHFKINALLFFLSESLQCQIAQCKLFSLVQQKTLQIDLIYMIEMVGLVYGM
jgi:hypothetical protein